MSRAGNAASSNETTAVQRPTAFPYQQELDQSWLCEAQRFFCILPIHSTTSVSSGRQSMQLHSPGFLVKEDSPSKPCVLPASLKGYRKAVTKAFAWLP